MEAYEAILIVCQFEAVLFGNYCQIAFANSEISHPDINVIKNNVAQFDYMLEMPNVIAPLKLPQRFGRRAGCWPKCTNPEILKTHYSLQDNTLKEKTVKFSQDCWRAYEENLKKYDHLHGLKNNCIFHFLCFFISPCFYNTSFIAHNSSRFDAVLVQRVLLDMDITAKTITAGSGLLQLSLPSHNISFLGSKKHFNLLYS